MSTTNSAISKSLFALRGLLSEPRSSMAWVQRGRHAKDRVFVAQTYWFLGDLPRVSLADILPETRHLDIFLPRALDRKFGLSITIEEAACLCAIAKCVKPRKVLEIGTSDGNTTLALACNLEAEGEVVTVDLPPDFDLKKDQASLAYFDQDSFNLTARDRLAQQYRGHPAAQRIKQVYGDSATLDWKALGGPFGLIFIDGCHSEAYVRSDSRNALANLTDSGVIVWHDYGMFPDVSKVVDEIQHANPALKLFAIEGTRLVIGLRQTNPNLKTAAPAVAKASL